MIKLENIKKSYLLGRGRRTVLAGLNLSLDEPQNLAIVGRNGAGKSTLLRIIAGTVPPDQGRVTRRGAFSWPLGFAGSFQAQLTGAENVDFVADIYGVGRKPLRDFVYEFSELGAYFYEPIRMYSSGMRSRLSFGVSMGIEFDVYLIDEITAVGDKRFKKKSGDVFKEKLKNSRIIMVSHSDSTLKNFCDVAIVLENGQASELMTVDDALAMHAENMKR